MPVGISSFHSDSTAVSKKSRFVPRCFVAVKAVVLWRPVMHVSNSVIMTHNAIFVESLLLLGLKKNLVAISVIISVK